MSEVTVRERYLKNGKKVYEYCFELAHEGGKRRRRTKSGFATKREARAAGRQPLENLKTLIIAVIGAVGVIILAKNVMEFAQAYQQQDSSTMNSVLKGIVAGVMMAGISTVLTFLGF